MDSLADLPHICNPVLYIFKGVLIRIGKSIKEIKDVSVFTGYGELHGLYTHSRSGVVHATTLKQLNQRQLQDVLSSRVKQTLNDYHLSCVGMWFSCQNMNIPVREVLRKKADTLNEGETCFCIIVDKSQSKFGFEDIDNRTRVFFLLKGTICKIDMRILNRESCFQIDSDFIGSISSRDHVDVEHQQNHSFEHGLKHPESIGTEMEDMSGKSKPDEKPDSEKPFKPDINHELPIPESETETDTEESALAETGTILAEKEASVEAGEKRVNNETETDNLTGRHEGMICGSAEDSTEEDGNIICAARQFKENNHSDAIASEESQIVNEGSVPTVVTAVLTDVVETTTKKEDKIDNPTKKSVAAVLTDVVETTTKKEDKIDNPTAGEEGIVTGPEAISTTESEIENEHDSDSSVAEQSEENNHSESITSKESQISNEESVLIEKKFVTAVLPDVLETTTKKEDKIDNPTAKEGIIPGPEAISTRESEIENGHDSDSSVAEQSEENNHSEAITPEESQIANEGSELIEEKSVAAVLTDVVETTMILHKIDNPTAEEEGIVHGPEAISTKESKIENGHDSDFSVAQQSEQNCKKENEGIDTENSSVANETSLPSDSFVAVLTEVKTDSIKIKQICQSKLIQ